MNLSFWLIIFIFGTCFGSFLNCIIYRLERKQSFLKGRSFCPNCRHQLTFFDLMPILSFVILKGKCRYCGRKISIQHPVVEFATGIIFCLVTLSVSEGSLGIITGSFAALRTTTELSILNFKTLINLAYLLIIFSLLVIIFIYDLKHYIIPDKVIYPAIGLVFLYRLFESFGFNVLGFLLTGISAGAFFFLLWLVSQGKWMGLGDVKLAFFMGLFLGFPNVLAAMFLAFFIGAIIGTGLIIGGKKTLKSQVPFGPFLIVGTFLALFWGREIINWYLGLLI